MWLCLLLWLVTCLCFYVHIVSTVDLVECIALRCDKCYCAFFHILGLQWMKSYMLLSVANFLTLFLCQLTCQSADIMLSLCGVGVRVRVNNFFSKTTRPRDMLFFLKDTLSIEDEKVFKA